MALFCQVRFTDSSSFKVSKSLSASIIERTMLIKPEHLFDCNCLYSFNWSCCILGVVSINPLCASINVVINSFSNAEDSNKARSIFAKRLISFNARQLNHAEL